MIKYLLLLPLLSFSQTDKEFHFYAGAITSSITYSLVKEKKGAFWYAVGSGVLIGTAKELYDINKSGFDKKDLAATILGGIAASITIKIIL
jgi:hypothetical protein